MRNENLYTMKQPELGKKISELRKERGITQEELVEQCNINVRTIQRIEAGDVTPRSYTLKSILEVLKVDFDSVIFTSTEYVAGKFDKIFGIKIDKIHRGLNLAWIFGIVYFIINFFELSIDYVVFTENRMLVGNFIYVLVKLVSLISFTLFIRGFIIAGSLYKNDLIQIISFILIIATFLFIFYDVISLFTSYNNTIDILRMKSVLFGAIGILFGISVLKLSKYTGSLATATGVVEIITGFFFLVVILSFLGLITLVLQELLEIILLYRITTLYKKSK